MANRKREALSDITNKFGITPTATLAKLVAASSSSNLFHKPPLSNSSSTNLRVFSESSSKSSTSIGSSNVNAAFNSKKTVQFRTPPHPSTTSHGGFGSKDASHNRRQLTEKPKKQREADVVVSHTPVEKMKDKGKAVAVPLSSALSEKTKGKGKAINLPLSSTLSDKRKEKGKAIAVPLSSTPLEKTKYRGKTIAVPLSSTPLEKTKDRGKTIAVPLSSTPSDKTKDDQNGHEGILKHSRSSSLKIKETGQEFLNPSSFFVQRTKDNGKPLNTVNSLEKTREKGKAILQPSDISDIAVHKRSSAVVAVNSPLLLTRKSEKRKFDAGPSSCPPMIRPKSIENILNEAGDVKSLKSCSDPHLKLRKKTCSRIKKTSKSSQDSDDKLPQDFVEQQRAYFKEVDEFELAEEEVSADELD